MDEGNNNAISHLRIEDHSGQMLGRLDTRNPLFPSVEEKIRKGLKLDSRSNILLSINEYTYSDLATIIAELLELSHGMEVNEALQDKFEEYLQLRPRDAVLLVKAEAGCSQSTATAAGGPQDAGPATPAPPTPAGDDAAQKRSRKPSDALAEEARKVFREIAIPNLPAETTTDLPGIKIPCLIDMKNPQVELIVKTAVAKMYQVFKKGGFPNITQADILSHCKV